MPRWVDKQQVDCTADGQSLPLAFVGNYAVVYDVDKIPELKFTFPVVETVERHHLAWHEDQMWQEGNRPPHWWTKQDPKEFVMQFRGNTLVEVGPRDKSIGIRLCDDRGHKMPYRKDAISSNHLSHAMLPKSGWVTLLMWLVIGSLLNVGVASAAEPPLPSAAYPSFEGERYETMVPETLDLAERMKLSLNGITRCVAGPPPNPFPCTQYHSNHFIEVTPAGPRVLRNVNLFGKYMLGALLARIVTGCEENLHVDNDWRNAWLDWQRINPVMLGAEGGRRLEWIAFNIRREGDPNKSAWNALAERAVGRLNEFSRSYKTGAWITFGTNIADEGHPNIEAITQAIETYVRSNAAVDSEVKGPEAWNASWMTWTVQGLCAVYRATGDTAALGLAGKLARYLKDEAKMVALDGRLLTGHPHPWPVIHLHHSCQAVMACAEYGQAAGDREFLQFANTAYQHVMDFPSSSRQIGFVPEYFYSMLPRKQDIDNTEACCSADAVLLALWLTLGEAADYWDDIDRYIRNHITTLQITDTRWFYELPENRGKWEYPDPEVEAKISPLVGQFGGWATPNEWHDPRFGPGIMTCCVGNSTRAFYYVWERMIDFSDGRLRVHLMLNRASPIADFNSYRPYEGKFEIELKKECGQILVRAPEWITTGSEEISLSIDGKSRQLRWAGRYLDVGSGKAGQTFALLFPIGTRKVETEIGRQSFTLTIKGNTVIAIDPPGQRIPLYQREHYRKDRAPLKKTVRYVSQAVSAW